MILALYIIGSVIGLVALSYRLRETHYDLQRVTGERNAYARALQLAGYALPRTDMAAITIDGTPLSPPSPSPLPAAAPGSVPDGRPPQ